MKRYAVHVCMNPDDPGERWKRTRAGALARLKECEAGMDRERGTGINMKWMYWSGEFGVAWDWLEKKHPRETRRMAAEEEAKMKGPELTIDQIKALAKERGVPGPDVVEHDEEYDGECYCQLCLSYLTT